MIAAPNKRILYLSGVHPGSIHDYTILQQCFTPQQHWFKKLKVRLDLGFQGFAALYRYEELFIPFKKNRVAKGHDNELNEEQKRINKQQAQQRIVVEHSIGGMKRYRILSNRLRMKAPAFINVILGVCAGLWNFVLK
jgi:DDE superfamily endonuclease